MEWKNLTVAQGNYTNFLGGCLNKGEGRRGKGGSHSSSMMDGPVGRGGGRREVQLQKEK